jgi:hypothetical protein
MNQKVRLSCVVIDCREVDDCRDEQFWRQSPIGAGTLMCRIAPKFHVCRSGTHCLFIRHVKRQTKCCTIC